VEPLKLPMVPDTSASVMYPPIPNSPYGSIGPKGRRTFPADP
jgi:hypothetical protein